MNNDKKISASIMCADLMNLQRDIEVLEKSGVDFLHLDVMDGSFVPNITLGFDICNAVGEISDIKRDIHFLLENPTIFIDRLNLKKGEMLSVHFETDSNLKLLSKLVRAKGAKFGVALNPETPIAVVGDYIKDLDFVLLMMIKPGFAGMKKEAGMIEKIAAMREYLSSHGREDMPIEVDGNVSFKNAKAMSQASGNIFVAGSSSIFSKKDTLENCIDLLKRSISIG